MRRAAAVTTVSLGILAITFAVASYLHLRSLTTASPAVDVSRYLDFPILSAGMLDTTTPKIIDVAVFTRQLTYRIYATGVTGLALIFIGGYLFQLPRSRVSPRRDPHAS